MKLDRRTLLLGSASLASTTALAGLPSVLTGAAHAQGNAAPAFRHGLSLFGDLKYPKGFAKFDYVRADAPKTGAVRQIAVGTFDNLNLVISGVKGTLASGVGEIYDTLMASSMDEVSAEYGLLAEAASYPDDHAWVVYRLNPDAKWHDGKPVTPEDVIFSLDVFKTHNPLYGAYYRHVVKAEKTGPRDIRFTFDRPGNRELPQIVGQLTVLPKHWWEGKDASGRQRDITATTLEVPLGSGAYRIKEVVPGRSLVLERAKNYWGAKLNVNVGRDNFNEIRYEYFRDMTVAREAFKGDQVDVFIENSAKDWATAYDFPAVRDGRVVLEEFPIRSVGRMQAFVFNLRRPLFSDWRLRRAFNLAFDFEEMNKQLFFSQYTRIASYFEGTELASSNVPQGLELEILEPLRGKVPESVFTTPYRNPVGGTPEAVRANLRDAIQLLKDAGFNYRDRKLVDKDGKPVEVEFLSADPSSERYILFYKPSLERIGVTVRLRTVDDAQYTNRIRNRDFDITTFVWGQSLSPGNEQREYWSSAAADQPGSRNIGGIKDEAIDALIERVIFAKDRPELVAATHALDRVLLHHHFVVPQWTYGKVRMARWNRFGRPDPLPQYGMSAFPTVWWFDKDRAGKAGQGE